MGYSWGGFDHQVQFVHLPTVDLAKMSACFRQRVIAFFLQRKLLNERLAKSPEARRVRLTLTEVSAACSALHRRSAARICSGARDPPAVF